MVRIWRAACAVAMVAGSIANGSGEAARARPDEVSRASLMQACRPVPGQTLETFYPVMPGWERKEPTSETDTQESVSRTTVDFDRGVSPDWILAVSRNDRAYQRPADHDRARRSADGQDCALRRDADEVPAN